ncbi:uncharacterized protein [Panulirus ornatus]|uniref:uncharacterized protein n=1 Tax=Panulirus ornatus TaxID=150431 RepID=UPI003A84AEC2
MKDQLVAVAEAAGNVINNNMSQQQIIEDFTTYGVHITDNNLVLKCLELCNQYGVDGEGIAACWISFSNSKGYDCLTLDRLEHFEREQLVKEKKPLTNAVENLQMYDASTFDSLNLSHHDDDQHDHVDDDDDDDHDDDLLAVYGGLTSPALKVSTTAGEGGGDHQPCPLTEAPQVKEKSEANAKDLGVTVSEKLEFM